MSGRSLKLLARLVACPRDYEWRELTTLMAALGFEESSGKSSSVKFRHSENPSFVVHLHRPHGRNPPTIPVVYLRQIVSRFKEWGFLDE